MGRVWQSPTSIKSDLGVELGNVEAWLAVEVLGSGVGLCFKGVVRVLGGGACQGTWSDLGACLGA